VATGLRWSLADARGLRRKLHPACALFFGVPIITDANRHRVSTGALRHVKIAASCFLVAIFHRWRHS
jgi:hypothetical protein